VDKTSLQSQIDDHLGTIVGLRKAADQSAATKETLERQLQSLQTDMRNAVRRTEAAERIQQELQAEGSSLMRSLDEMRPKIVELTNMKLELGEKLNISEQAVRDRDGIIAQLESTLQAAQDQTESLNTKLLDTETTREKDRSAAQETQDELQRGYAELETELSDALASIRELELDRAGQRQLANKQVEELDRMAATSQGLEEDVASLRQEVEERNLAEVEQQEFLERARTDIEVLRADLVVKVQEIDELRAELSTAAAAANSSSPSPSLDKEMMNALKQQHRLELSAAQSQIRSLQTSVFEAEARAHSFQRQLSQSEDQLAQLRALSSPSTLPPPPRPLSSASSSSSPHVPQLEHPPRPSSRARNHSDDLRRASLTHRKGSNNSSIPLGATAHPAFGANLSPETRHKRKVSLGMLKARIDSEMAAAGSVLPSRVASPLHAEVAERGSPQMDPHATNSIQSSHKRPQFLDESHIFWCHSCRGELVVL
jgi:myosin protein heavy chain